MFEARLKYSRITPRKLRYVADTIRGKNVSEARRLLKFQARRGAFLLMKLLNSAVANATQNPEIAEDSLFVKSIMVGDGVTLKRWRAAPQGRGVPIRKHTSHTTLVLDVRKTAPTPQQKPSKTEKK
jgi:large subunit ribosomal protein L22